MKILVVIFLTICSYVAHAKPVKVAKPASDSSKYTKSLVWTVDRAQKAPVWLLGDADYSIKFKYLDTSDPVTARAKPAEVETSKVDENSEENSEENALEENE